MPAPVPSSNATEVRLFRDDRSQALRIPVEFELPVDRVLIRKEGERLIIEPIAGATNILDLLADWKKAAPLGPGDEFPEVEDMPARPEDVF